MKLNYPPGSAVHYFPNGNSWLARLRVNNHSCRRRARTGQERAAVSREDAESGGRRCIESGVVIYRNSCGQPRFETSPVTFAENFPLVIALA